MCVCVHLSPGLVFRHGDSAWWWSQATHVILDTDVGGPGGGAGSTGACLLLKAEV